MINQFVKIVNQNAKVLLAASLGLIIGPWLVRTLVSCAAQHTISEYAACTLRPGWAVGAAMILGVFLALMYCRIKNIQQFYVHAVLQAVGVVGIFGFHKTAFIIGPLYVVVLLMINHYKNTRDWFKISPIYTIAYLSVLLLLSELSGKIPLPGHEYYALTKVWRQLFPQMGKELWLIYFPLVTAIISFVFLFVWKKFRSIGLGLLVAVLLLLPAAYILARLTFREALNF